MCVFCDKYKSGFNILMENETCFAIMDEYPVNMGHMLILPKQCKETYFDLSYLELEDMHMLINNCKKKLAREIAPDGYNIGYNCGEWAGQSIDHCHAHLIPRFAGDVPRDELRGGIRNFKKPLKELDY